MDEEYNRICDKLGFIPSEYRYTGKAEEDDRQENPFSVLSVDEIDYLYNHGYLNQQ